MLLHRGTALPDRRAHRAAGTMPCMPPLPFLLLLLLLPATPALPRRIIPLPTSPSSRQNVSCPIVLPHPPARPSRPSHRITAPRITGGISATPFTRSYLVSFSDPTNRFACSGSLLSPRWVLTAAHCHIHTTWYARVATRRATSGPPTPIARVLTHEWYDNERMDSPGDVAVVELATDAPLSANYVMINANDSVPVPGAFARAAGYGKTLRADQDELNPEPDQVDGPVNNPDKCTKIYHGYLDVIDRFFICAGYGKGGCQADSCHGDSGGPLVQFDKNNQPVQVGVVSFGLECGAQGVPGVYVRVASFVKWLKNNGVVFNTSTSARATFAEGSKDAASDEASVTVLQVIEDQLDPDAGDGDLKISKITFSIICIIAGIALIGLIILTLLVFSARGRSRREEQEVRDLTADDAQGNMPSVQQTGMVNRDNLRLAISLLQAIPDGQAQGADGSAGDTAPMEAEGLEGTVRSRPSNRDAKEINRTLITRNSRVIQRCG